MKLPPQFKLRRTMQLAWPLLITLPIFPMHVLAGDLPKGGQVTAGSAQIKAPVEGKLVVKQDSQRAVIKWSDFSIGPGNTVTFAQPNPGAATLNIVSGTSPSSIAGTLQANGSVFLINQNGIAITPTGLVDTRSGFLASTLRMDEDKFMGGAFQFSGGGGAVHNAGRLQTGDGGVVALLGGTVANAGVISAPLGTVVLASGAAASIDLNGGGFLRVVLPANAVDTKGAALVSNSGVIEADGGRVFLQAATVRQAQREAVNMPGEIRARSVSGVNGAVVLDGGEGGVVSVSGTVNANSSTSGGRIDIAGNTVTLTGAKLEATGAEIGGLIRVGGAFQGGRDQASDSQNAEVFVNRFGVVPSLLSASETRIDAASSLDVSASGIYGKGGTAIVWSNHNTVMDGAVKARGNGSGGAVEVSSKSLVQFVAINRLDLGKGGTVLLDPQNITINGTVQAAPGNISYGTNPGTTTILNDTDLATLLATGTSVSLQASQDISWANAFYGQSGPTSGLGNLSLAAGRSVTLSGAFTTHNANWTIVANDTAAHGVVDADRGAGTAGINLFGADFVNANGALSLTLADGAGNTNREVDGIRLGGFNGNSLSAVITPGAVPSFGISKITLTKPITTSVGITLTGNLNNQPFTSPLVLSGPTVNWTNEKTGGIISGERVIKFVENGVTTRYGDFGFGFPSTTDALRMSLGNGGTTAATRSYGDADSIATIGVQQLSFATHSTANTTTDAIASILQAGSLSATGPGVTANVGSYTSTITATSSIAAASGLAKSYFIDLTAGTVPLTVAQRVLTPTVNTGTYVYGSPTAVVTLSNIANGDALLPTATLKAGLAGAGASIGSASAMTLSGAAGGTSANFSLADTAPVESLSYILASLSGTQAANYSLDLSGTVAANVTITPKSLGFTGGNSSQTYGSSSLPSPSLTGVVGSDNVSGGTQAIGVVSSGTAGGSGLRPVGTYTVGFSTLAGANAGNYVLASSGNTPNQVTITPATLNFQVAGTVNSVYGSAASGLPGATLSGVFGGDSIAASLTADGNAIGSQLAAGSYGLGVGALSGTGSGNYDIASSGNTTGTLNVAPKPINYVGSTITQTYGSSTLPAPALTGIVGADAVVGGTQQISQFVTANTGESGARPVGTYQVSLATLSGAAASNYTLSATGNVPNSVVIVPKPLTFQLTGGSGTTTYGTLALLPTLALTGVVAGDVIGGNVAALSNGTATTISARTAAGSYTWGVGAFTGVGLGNYSVASSGNTVSNLTIAQKPVTWAVGSATAVYGDALANASTVSGLLSGDAVTPVLQARTAGGAADARPVVGSADTVVVASLGGAAGGNYLLQPSGNTPGALTVTPRPVTYSVASTSSVYGTLAQPGTVTFSNLATGESAPTATLSISQSGSSVALNAKSPAGTYALQVTALNNPNYQLAATGNTNGQINIARKPLSFSVPSSNFVYGTQGTLAAGTIVGVIAGDDVIAGPVAFTSGTFYTAQTAAGVYTNQLMVSRLQGSAASNYELTNTGSNLGSLIIAPKQINYSTSLFYLGQPIGGTQTYGTLSNLGGNTFALSLGNQGAKSTLTGVLPSDQRDVNLVPNLPVLPTSTGGLYVAGTYNWTGGKLTGSRAGNYILAASGNTDASLTITPSQLTAVTSLRDASGSIVKTWVYGGSAGYSLNIGLGGAALGDQVTASPVLTKAQGGDSTLNSKLPAGSYSVSASALVGADAANYVLRVLPAVAGFDSILVTQKPLTLQFSDVTTTYGQQAAASLPTLSGLLAGDAVAANVVVRNAAGGLVNLQPKTAAGNYVMTSTGLAGADASNYLLAGGTGTLQINRLALGYAVDPATLSQTYGGKVVVPAGVTGVLAGDTVTVSPQASPVGRTATGSTAIQSLANSPLLDAGTYNFLTPLSGADAANYQVPAIPNITIAKRNLTATISDHSTVYGTLSTAQVALANVLTGQSVVGTVTTKNSAGAVIGYSATTDAGTYSDQVTGLTGTTAANYSVTSPIRSWVIAPKTLSMSVSPNTDTIYGTAPQVASYSGVLFGDDVGFELVGSGAMSSARLVDDGKGGLTYLPKLDFGTYSFSISNTLSGAKGGNYRLLGGATGSVFVDKKQLAFTTFAASSTVYGSPAALGSLGGILAGDDIGVQVASGAIASTRLPVAADGTVLYGGKLDAGSYSFTINNNLVGTSANNYRLTPGTGNLTVNPKPVLYKVENVTGQYGNYKACETPTCNPWEPGVVMGAVSFNGVLPGDALGGTVGLLDFNGRSGSMTSTTPVGSYFEVVTGLTGVSAKNYVVAPQGSQPGVLTVTPMWLGFETSSAVFVSGVGLVGTPGQVTLRGPAGGVPINGDDVTLLVEGRSDNPTTPVLTSLSDLSKLQVGRYYFGPVFPNAAALVGKDAGNYRLLLGGVGSTSGVKNAGNDYGTLDVFSSATLGLDLASASVGVGALPGIQIANAVRTFDSILAAASSFTGLPAGIAAGISSVAIVPPAKPATAPAATSTTTTAPTSTPGAPAPQVQAPSADGKDGKATGDTAGFGRDITLTGAAANAALGDTGGSAGARASASTTTSANVGAANFSAQSSASTDALLKFGITGVELIANASAHVDVMMTVGPGYVAYGLQADAAVGLSIGPTGASLSASATITAYEKMGLSGSAGALGTGSADVTGAVFVTVGAEQTAGYKDGKIVTKLETTVGVGASAGAHGGLSGSTGSIDVGATIYSPGSLGGKFNWTGGVSDGALTVGLDLGAKLGIGGLALNINFTIDPVKAFDDLATGLAPAGQALFELVGRGDTATDKLRARVKEGNNLTGNPAARYSFLLANPDARTGDAWSKGTADANNAFFNSYKNILDRTANRLIEQNKVQSRFLELLRTDPKAAVAYAHSGAIQKAKGVGGYGLAGDAAAIGIRLVVVNGSPTYESIPK